jgi:hypothetical protein
MYTRNINILYAVAETRSHVIKEERGIRVSLVAQNRRRWKLAELEKKFGSDS